MQLTLYYSVLSCSMLPYIALTEAEQDFEVRVVNFGKGDNYSPEFLRLNPNHQVPVLIIDGEPVTENMAILLWIDGHFPQARLMPAADMDRTRAISLMAWCDAGIHPFLTPNGMPERYCDLPDTAEGVRRAAQKMLHKRFQVAEERLANREWFFDHMTLPDLFFFWCFRRATKFKIDVSAYPNCLAHMERVAQRPSTQKVLALEAKTMIEIGRKE